MAHLTTDRFQEAVEHIISLFQGDAASTPALDDLQLKETELRLRICLQELVCDAQIDMQEKYNRERLLLDEGARKDRKHGQRIAHRVHQVQVKTLESKVATMETELESCRAEMSKAQRALAEARHDSAEEQRANQRRNSCEAERLAAWESSLCAREKELSAMPDSQRAPVLPSIPLPEVDRSVEVSDHVSPKAMTVTATERRMTAPPLACIPPPRSPLSDPDTLMYMMPRTSTPSSGTQRFSEKQSSSATFATASQQYDFSNRPHRLTARKQIRDDENSASLFTTGMLEPVSHSSEQADVPSVKEMVGGIAASIAARVKMFS